MDTKQLEKHIQAILKLIGENPKREGLLNTPKRVAKAYERLFSGYEKKPKDIATVFENEGYDEMVIVKDIRLKNWLFRSNIYHRRCKNCH